MISIALLAAYAISTPVLSSQYKTHYCQGAPLAMYLFDVVDLTVQQSGGEVWTPSYTFAVSDLPLSSCGAAGIFPGFAGCCYDTAVTGYIDWDSSVQTAVTSFPEASAPPLANGVGYCHLQSNGDGALNGYMQAWYGSLQNTCIEGQAICYSNKTLAIYPLANCQGPPEYFQLDASRNITSATMGNLIADYIVFQGGAQPILWTTYVPIFQISWYKFDLGFEYFCSVALTCAFIICCYKIYFLLRMIIFMNKFGLYYKINLASQCFYFFWIILSAIYWLLNSPIVINSITYELVGFFDNLSTFSSVMATHYSLVIHNMALSNRFKYMATFAIVALHLLLSGSGFFLYVINYGPVPPISPDFFRFILGWQFFVVFWIILMLLWNTIVPIMYGVLLASEPTYWAKLKSVMTSNWKIKYLVSVQVFLAILYMVLFCIQTKTYYLCNDRALYAMSSLFIVILELLEMIVFNLSALFRASLGVRIASKGSASISKKATTSQKVQSLISPKTLQGIKI